MMPSICKEATMRCAQTCIPQAIHNTRYQDYGFDYSDDDEGNDSGSVDVENLYYTAKCTTSDHGCLALG